MSTAELKSDVFGINAHVPDTKLLDLVAQANIKWIRADFYWSEIEKLQGKPPDFSTYDDLVSEASRRGIQIYATLSRTPAWAGGGRDGNSPPKSVELWAAFVGRTVERYRSRIQHWGMWNEPNLDAHWLGGNARYRDMILIPGGKAAKAVAPNCLVVAPEVSITSGNAWWECIREVCKGAGKDSFDVFSCHVYKGRGPELVVESLEVGQRLWDPVRAFAPPLVRKMFPKYKSVREVMAEQGVQEKSLWLTEVGWSTAKGHLSQEQQAQCYSILCGLLIDKVAVGWFGKVFFYELWDDAPVRENLWGIVSNDYRPKLAFGTYRDFLSAV